MGKVSFVHPSLREHGTDMAIQEEEKGETGYFTDKLHDECS
ncbi:MAG TPA: hypothetical protein QGF70_04060 [Candidatus Thalassarchaeaceae archaeon]|nr:hypothetical protein [Candidatus Thalassarchaeaceae archaeon]